VILDLESVPARTRHRSNNCALLDSACSKGTSSCLPIRRNVGPNIVETAAVLFEPLDGSNAIGDRQRCAAFSQGSLIVCISSRDSIQQTRSGRCEIEQKHFQSINYKFLLVAKYFIQFSKRLVGKLEIIRKRNVTEHGSICKPVISINDKYFSTSLSARSTYIFECERPTNTIVPYENGISVSRNSVPQCRTLRHNEHREMLWTHPLPDPFHVASL